MLKISPECNHCGFCVLDCPSNIIEMKPGEYPEMVEGPSGRVCLRCGHCEAVCPKGALYNEKMPHSEEPVKIPGYPVLDPETAEMFLRSRRSTRSFKDETVPRELVEKLLNIARYVQTGANFQGVSFIVLSGKDNWQKLYDLTLNHLSKSEDPYYQGVYRRIIDVKNADRLFRNVPMFIFGLTRKDKPLTSRNVHTSMDYIELYAPTLGLATVNLGWLDYYVSTDDEAFRKLLNIPDELVVTGVPIGLGYPKYRHTYLVGNRDPLSLYWRD